MAVSDDYLAQLLALLPEGDAWPRDTDTDLARVLRGIAVELARIEGDADRLAESALPDSAVDDLLPDWERVLGVAGRAAVVAQIAARGGASKAYFTDLASRLGYQVQIEDGFTGRVEGMSTVSDCNASLYTDDRAFTWRVHVAGSGPALPLEALFLKLKPAHTAVEFVYEGVSA